MPERDPRHLPNLGLTEWSYACPCIRCQWEQWWNEGDNTVIGMPTEPHPEGEYQEWFDDRDHWAGVWRHPND